MEPRKPVFAVEYIKETVDALQYVVECEHGISESTQWSIDVLTAFFEVQEKHAVIGLAEKKFRSLNLTQPEEKIPFQRQTANTFSYDEFARLNQHRRSVRWYLDKTVPRNLVDKAIDVARQAPSACNRQPFYLKIYDTKKDIERIASLPGGTRGFSHNFKMVIAVVGQLRNYYSEADRHIIFIDGSLFAMNFILALETLGLSSCMINWPENVAVEKKAVKELHLESDERILFLISVGYADLQKKVPYSEKKSIDDIRSYCS